MAGKKFLRPSDPIFMENSNFANNLKIGHLGKNCFINYKYDKIGNKKLPFTEIER